MTEVSLWFDELSVLLIDQLLCYLFNLFLQYDFVVLTAGGFIDTTEGSDTFGEFRASAKEVSNEESLGIIIFDNTNASYLSQINLFSFESNAKERLDEVKSLVNSGENPGNCNNVLSYFHTGT